MVLYCVLNLPHSFIVVLYCVCAAGVSSEQNCSYRDLLTHLDLDSQKYTALRPVLHHRTPTQVHLIVAIEAILDVVSRVKVVLLPSGLPDLCENKSSAKHRRLPVRLTSHY